MKGELQLKDTELKHTVQEAVIEKEQEISHLNNELTISKNEYLLKEKNLREHFEEKIKDKDEQIALLKKIMILKLDLRGILFFVISTRMVQK